MHSRCHQLESRTWQHHSATPHRHHPASLAPALNYPRPCLGLFSHSIFRLSCSASATLLFPPELQTPHAGWIERAFFSPYFYFTLDLSLSELVCVATSSRPIAIISAHPLVPTVTSTLGRGWPKSQTPCRRYSNLRILSVMVRAR